MPTSTRSRSSAAKPNCTKGFSCKNACVAKGRNCRNPLDGQFKTYGEWLQDAVARGTPLSDSHKQEAEARGIRATPTPAPAPRPTPESEREARRNTPVPEGMRRSERDDIIDYVFKVGNNNVRIYFINDSYTGKLTRNVGFQVNGEYDMNRSRISDEERNEISRKVAAALRYQITQDDDATYACTAYEYDGQQGFRALAYTRMGFSRPIGATPGGVQSAVVKDGKIDPEASRLEMERRERASYYNSHEHYDNQWAQQVERINAERIATREARRAARRA